MKASVVLILENQEQTVEVATVTVATMEQIELAGKRALAFNIALVAASVKTAGDEVRGNEAWVRSLPFFPESSDEDTSAFHKMLKAVMEVNGMRVATPTVTKAGEEKPSVAAIQ